MGIDTEWPFVRRAEGETAPPPRMEDFHRLAVGAPPQSPSASSGPAGTIPFGLIMRRLS